MMGDSSMDNLLFVAFFPINIGIMNREKI